MLFHNPPTCPHHHTLGGIVLALVLLLAVGAQPNAHQATVTGLADVWAMLESGQGTEKNLPEALYLLLTGRYPEAARAVDNDLRRQMPWIEGYLTGLVAASKGLTVVSSDRFELWLPPEQAFLADMALPALERAADHFERIFRHRPKRPRPIRVEIYPDKASFSAASTLTEETLERSGAIAICKFYRLMILSPRALPLGYRWLDALTHEYLHLLINELSAARAELWLHEGTARYFDTAPRLEAPLFLTPRQKTDLLEAREEGRLIPFARMSPSLVYLDSQEEVSLAFAQVSYAVSILVAERGPARFSGFLRRLARENLDTALTRAYGLTTDALETRYQSLLEEEAWPRTKGALADHHRFTPVAEEHLVGADARGRVRLGDRMRRMGLLEAALMEYEAASELEPDNAVVLLKIARTHAALGDPIKAETLLRRAIRANPNYVTPYVDLGMLLEGEEALGFLKDAAAINPFHPGVVARMRDIYIALGQPHAAQHAEDILRTLTR